ncbi:MAG TPA: hypothetical protein VHC90_23890 [Bryobacteraceae bacterium]|nr:hypothetical protein [Bryobacteraceae bacterium]
MSTPVNPVLFTEPRNQTTAGATATTYTAVVSDSDGPADLAGANILINSSVNGQNACWIWFQ